MAADRRGLDREVNEARAPDSRGGRGGSSLPRVAKPDTVRRLRSVDIGTLRSCVARLSDKVWQVEDTDKENRYRVFHHTRHIVFRFIRGNRDPREFYSRPIWRVWQHWLLPVMAQASASYGFAEPVYPKAMLARLEAGRRIDEHRDGEGSHPLVHRIHVPLETSPEAVLTVGGEDFHLSAGHAWEVNNLVPHSVFNGGEQDRIHLVFEVFEEGGGPPRKPLRAGIA